VGAGSGVNHKVLGNYMTLFINDPYIAENYLDTLGDAGLLGLFLGVSSAVQEGDVDYVYFESLKVYEFSK
jgi:hypothetical protein